MLNTIETQKREIHIRAQVMVHEDHVRKTNPKMVAQPPQIMDQTQSVPTPTNKPDQTPASTETTSTKGGGYMSLYLLLTAGAALVAFLLTR